MICERHRVVMLSSESVYPTKHEHGEPTRHIYTFMCMACLSGHTLECDLITGRSVTSPYQGSVPKAKAVRVAHHAPKMTAAKEVIENPALQLSIF